MFDSREDLRDLARSRPEMLAIGNGCQTVDKPTHQLRKRLVGRIHVGKQRVAAVILWHFAQMEDRPHRSKVPGL